jgi:hypothetical protein
MLFSISERFWQFSINLILFGLLTCRFDSLETFDEVVFSLVQLATRWNLRPADDRSVNHTDNASVIILRPHGYGYRLPLLYLLGAFAVADIAVYLGVVDISFGQGRWDHVSLSSDFY